MLSSPTTLEPQLIRVQRASPDQMPSAPHVNALPERTKPVSQLMEQSSPPYSVSPLHAAERVESTLAVEYDTAAVLPQSGRTQLGIAPLHVPSALQTLVTKETPANVPSECTTRKFVLQLSEHESPTVPAHCPDVEPSVSVSAPQLIALHTREPSHAAVLALQVNTAVP